MAQLILKNKNTIVTTHLEVADKFFKRMVGLLGRKQISDKEVLWIHRCNSIHTFFMNFAIDAVFVGADLKVTKICHSLPPWRLTIPNFKSKSVLEMKAGVAKQLGIQIGDQFYVGS